MHAQDEASHSPPTAGPPAAAAPAAAPATPAARWRQRRARLVPMVGIGAGLALLAALVAVLLQTPATLVALSVQAESLELRVRVPDAARFSLPEARPLEGGQVLAELLVEPREGSVVAYSRPAREALVVSVQGPVHWSWAGPPDALGRPTRQQAGSAHGVSFQTPTEARPGRARHVRLPVHGDRARFGEHALHMVEPGQHQLPILQGRLTVYARALSSLFGWPLPPPFEPHALYVAGELPLPGGSVIEDGDAGRAEAPARGRASGPVWTGFAQVDLRDDGDGAMAVEAATNAASVQLYLPAPNLSAQRHPADPETVSLTLMARLTGDPNLLLLYGALAVLALLLGMLLGLLDLRSHYAKDAK